LRRLQRDWNGDKDILDGYVLYRSYSCPAQGTEIRAPQALPISPQEIEIKFKTEPVGCAYRYQLTAYGRQGESNPSNAVEGETCSAFAGVNVKFQEIKISQPNNPIQAKVRVFANEYNRATPKVWIRASSYDFSAIEMDRVKPNNIVGVPLADNELLQLGFVVSEITADGFEKTASVCQGFSLQPPVRMWKDKQGITSIRSADGVCEVTISSDASPNIGINIGKIVAPQADVALAEKKIAQLGENYCVYVNNNGPDALSNNYIDLDSAWLCADAKNQDVVSDNNTRMFKASPYLSQGDNGQWVVIDSETRVRLNVVLQSRCYTEYLVPQAFFKFGPVGKPSEEWIEQNSS